MKSYENEIDDNLESAWFQVYGTTFPSDKGGVDTDHDPEDVYEDVEAGVTALIDYADAEELTGVIENEGIPTAKREVPNWVREELVIEEGFVNENSFKKLANKCWNVMTQLTDLKKAREEGF